MNTPDTSKVIAWGFNLATVLAIGLCGWMLTEVHRQSNELMMVKGIVERLSIQRADIDKLKDTTNANAKDIAVLKVTTADTFKFLQERFDKTDSVIETRMLAFEKKLDSLKSK